MAFCIVYSPFIVVTYDSDRLHLSQGVCTSLQVNVNLVETCTWVRAVFAAIIGNLAFAIEFVVTCPDISSSLWLELELAIQVIESLILAVTISTIEGICCLPIRITANLIEVLTE